MLVHNRVRRDPNTITSGGVGLTFSGASIFLRGLRFPGRTVDRVLVSVFYRFLFLLQFLLLLSQKSLQHFSIALLRLFIGRGQMDAPTPPSRSHELLLLLLSMVGIIRIEHGQAFPVPSNRGVRFSNGPLHDVPTTNHGKTKVEAPHDGPTPGWQRIAPTFVNGRFQALVAHVQPM